MSTVQKNFGRPQDNREEVQFMEKLRNSKLQAIIANCELELCLSNFEAESETKKSSRKRKNAEIQPFKKSQLISQNQLFSLNFASLDIDRKEVLSKQFKRVRQTWEFIDIEEDDELPLYLFQNEGDLSFILHSLMQKQGYTQFSPPQLLFIELMIIESSSLLTKKVFQYYASNINYIVAAIEVGIKKIHLKKKEQNVKEKNEKTITINEEVDQFYGMDIEFQKKESEENQEKQIATVEKKKKIKRKPRKKSSLLLQKRTPKKKPFEEKDEDESIDIDEEIQYPEGKKLALITANFITWAYWYIFPK